MHLDYYIWYSNVIPGVNHFLRLSPRADDNIDHVDYKGDPRGTSIELRTVWFPSASGVDAAHQYRWFVMLFIHSLTSSQSLYLANFNSF